MSLTSTSDVEDITYRVETSTNLCDWIGEEVDLCDLRPDGTRSASVMRAGSNRYLRLVVGQ